ncbi:S-layer homology domain-containing protein [Geobacillus subterraneus]|uniref:S-layer homology domain-containing protein n=1 Tax=Geobacillus subterraneus TaxID=129338 RepID=UPI001442BF38|nr:S-layer homology domain-containing protein [Geobacillus subterraneus]QIZ65918.1 trypsin-like serine protease [Geobacillus subterraneus]
MERKRRRRKAAAVWLSALLVFVWVWGPYAGPAQAVESRGLFPDVSTGRAEVEYLANLGIIQGYKDGKFHPEAVLTRVQAVLMIIRQLGLDTEEELPMPFMDVKPGSTGYKEIALAANLGIVSGKTAQSFDPYGKLTRAQMAKIFANAYHLSGKMATDFTDVRPDHWAYPYVHALAANEVTLGYPDGTFRPNASLTRLQFALFMARYMNDEFKPPLTKQLSRKEIIAKKESVVTVYVYDENGKELAQGSGFAVANGLIVTNFHVVSGGSAFTVLTSDGEEYEIEGVVDYDLDLDVALLKPIDLLPLKPLRLGSVDMVEAGDDIVAIGSPLGFSDSVSTGVVSAIRTLELEEGYADFIQFTAPVTNGSSGGPLLNMYGYVVGLVSFGFDQGELNFALAADYFKEAVQAYAQVPFYQLPVIPTDELPVYEDDEGDPVATETFRLEEPLVDVVAHPSLPILYGIDYSNHAVEINYETRNIRKISLPLPAERLSFANDELYITLLKGEHNHYWWSEDQQGAIAIVDTKEFRLKETFDIALDPFDIAADQRYIYVSSGSGQHTYIKSYDRFTKQEVASERIYEASRIEMHPSQSMIYAITTNTIPITMSVYRVADGRFVETYPSPYHSDYDLEPDLTISPDGKYIFNDAGFVFYAAAQKGVNMTYAATIEPFSAIAFDLPRGRVYTAQGHQVTAYNSTSLKKEKRWAINGEIEAMMVHNGNIVLVTRQSLDNSGVKVPTIQIFTPV